MRPPAVVMGGVHGKHPALLTLAEDQHPIGDLVRTVNAKRSARQFARGHRGGIFTTSMLASAMTCGCRDLARAPWPADPGQGATA
jgi:hypothetical protein